MAVGADVSVGQTKTSGSGLKTSKLILDEAGYRKIIDDIMGAENGLASLLQGESTAGIFGSTTNTLMAQRFAQDLAGELAKLTAESVTTTEEEQKQSQTKASSGLKTVICTELERQGLLDTELYNAGHAHFLTLSPQTVRGYRVWANKVVPLMQNSKKLSQTLAPIANARYEHVTGQRKNLIGWLTVHVCQPICYMIGFFVPEGKDYGHQAAVN